MKNGETLSDMLENAVLAGEVPYQANRRAIRALDVQDDMSAGNEELETTLNGIDKFIRDLQEVEDNARFVAKNITLL